MMAQSLFSALNVLAKVYAHLRYQDKYFCSAKDKNAVKTAVQKLKATDGQPRLKELFPELDFRAMLGEDALTQWKPPRPGDCANETKVFKLLVAAMNGSVDLGFSAADAEFVWQQFRNALAHMAAPKSMVESGGPTNKLHSFRKSGSGDWICNVDRLTEDVQAVASWVCQTVEQETEQGRIGDTLDWILDAPSMGKGDFRTSATTTTTSSVTTQTSFHGYTGPYSVTHIPPPFDTKADRTGTETSPAKTDPHS
jgi:hypothetical protein